MQKRKRILLTGLSSNRGGIEAYLYRLASYMDREKFQFDFLLTESESPCFYQELLRLGCRFYPVTSRRRNFYKHYSDLKRLYREERFDLIHFNVNSFSDIAPCTLFLKTDGRALVVSHNAGMLKSFHTHLLHQLNRYRFPKEKVICAAVSQLAGQWMFGKEAKFFVINNSVDTHTFHFSTEARTSARKEFSISENETLVLHVGYFRTQKNHEFLIRIFNEFVKQNPLSKLMLVGQGELEEQIRNQVYSLGLSDKVIFAGVRKDMPQIFSAADIFLFPSIYEGFPTVILEAVSSGLGCIMSDAITKEAVISPLCTALPLDEPLEVWANALIQCPCLQHREDGKDVIDKAGLSVEKEMEKIEMLYEKVLD